MWVVYLILIVLGLVLIGGVYFYTRTHPEGRSRGGEREYSHSPMGKFGLSGVREPAKPRPPIPDDRQATATKTAESAKNDSRILVLNLRLPEAGVPAARVIEVLSRLGFTPGERQIYHRLDGDDTPLCSAADLFEPGILYPLPDDARLRGLTFFFEARPGAAAIERLDRMLGAAQECAERLGGHIEDQAHHPLTAARELDLKLMAAGARSG